MNEPESIPRPAPFPFAPPSRRMQIALGLITMGFWLAVIYAIIQDHSSARVVPMVVKLALSATGFYFWMFTWEINGQMLVEILFYVTKGSLLGVVLGFAGLSMMAACWLMILLLPAYTDWRHRPWLLLILQNTYAIAQGIGAWMFLEKI